jgi:hypothetical protein
MNPIRVIGMLLLVISISRASQAQLPCVEAWHHIRDMPMVVYQCMDSCTHVNRVGSATVRSQVISAPDQIISESQIQQNLSQTCYSERAVSFSGSVSSTRGMSVSAADSQGTTVSAQGTFGFQVGEFAKGTLSGQLGWSHSWNWTVTNTYSEQVTVSLASTQFWPQSGKRRVTGPASLSVLCTVKGTRGSVTVDARNEHNCTTVVMAKYKALKGWECNGWPAGSKRLTKYANDGMVAFSATASGFVPKNVVVGAIVESGAIQTGCDGT